MSESSAESGDRVEAGAAGDAADVVIRLAGLHKVYRPPAIGIRQRLRNLAHPKAPRSPALRPMDLEVRRGEAIGIVGRNGSGKSTMLRLLAQSLSPSGGEIEMTGRVGTLLDLGAGIDPEFTGEENARVLAMLAGLSGREAAGKLEEIHAFSGLEDAFYRPVKTYSSGMTMRLGFSASICTSPEILLIDEVLAVGDAFFQQRCLRRMRELKESGMTIVLVSHDASAVLSLCDRCLWLESGAVVLDDRPKEVIKRFLAARYTDDCALDGSALGRLDLGVSAESAVEPVHGFPEGTQIERVGNGRAQIVGLEVRGPQGLAARYVRPGDPLEIAITARALEDVDSVLIGFTLRNRLGDVVAATNSEIEGFRLPAMTCGSEVDVAFRLDWPPVTSGRYSLSPAIAEGRVDAHAMCDWIEDAVVLECENSRVPFGWLELAGVDLAVGAVREVGSDEMPEVPEEADPQIVFALENPTDPVVDPVWITSDRKLFLSGWAFDVNEPETRVQVRIGDAAPIPASTGHFREDVARVHQGIPHAGRSGFGALVPLPDGGADGGPGEGGPVRIALEAGRPDGPFRVIAEKDLELPPRRGAVVETHPTAAFRAVVERENRPARIQFVTHGLNLEGAPICFFELASSLDSARFEVHVSSPVVGPLEPVFKEAGVDLRMLTVDPTCGGVDEYEAMVRRTAAQLSVSRPDLIVANTLETFWAISVAEELGIPSIWIVHESEDPAFYFHSRLPTPIAEQAHRALGLAEHVVFVAEATRALFESSLSSGQSVVIPNGLALDRFDPSTRSEARVTIGRRLGLSEETSLVVCVGTTCIRKGQLELVRALAHLREAGRDFHALFLGVIPGDYLGRIESEVASLGLGDHVTLMPPVEDSRPYFAAADVVACPSFQESLPRVVQEAMAFAVPVVATDVFGIPELVRDGVEGLLVEPGDVEALAGAMTRILERPEWARQLGAAGRARMQAEFPARLSTERYTNLFDATLAQDAQDAQD